MSAREKQDSTPGLYRERHRPQVHFTPPINWLNDPNGMVYYNGLYHLFYQYNPADKVWSDMSWGHATSRDLIHWQHRPVALYSQADGLGYIFSGSAVVDWYNTTGLKRGEHPPLVAMFTQSSRHNVQVQSLAYSVDGGDNWRMYEHNPVLANPGIEDFRDPKVFWSARHQTWIMVLAAGRQVKIYRSANLFEWQHCSDFTGGDLTGVWECPDLFPLLDEVTGETRWVMLVSMNPGGPNGGSGTQYFVGDFDGYGFCTSHDQVLWLDYGPDNYAGVTWSDAPHCEDRRLMIAWMNNWAYANAVPTAPWRGMMTLPRELRLVGAGSSSKLAAGPIPDLAGLRQAPVLNIRDQLIDSTPLALAPAGADCLDIELAIDAGASVTRGWALRFFNDSDDELVLAFDKPAGSLTLDRSRCALKMQDNGSFTRQLLAPLQLNEQSQYRLRIVKDASSVEIFTGDGHGLLTAQYFARCTLDRMEFRNLDSQAPVLLNSATVYPLSSIWQQQGGLQVGTRAPNPTARHDLEAT